MSRNSYSGGTGGGTIRITGGRFKTGLDGGLCDYGRRRDIVLSPDARRCPTNATRLVHLTAKPDVQVLLCPVHYLILTRNGTVERSR